MHKKNLEHFQIIKNILNIEDKEYSKFEKIEEGRIFRAIIPANTYPGQTEEIKTFAYPIVIFAHKELNEDDVYRVTKIFWENISKRRDEPTFKGIKIGNAVKGSKTPLHMGAEKYFREIGIIK